MRSSFELQKKTRHFNNNFVLLLLLFVTIASINTSPDQYLNFNDQSILDSEYKRSQFEENAYTVKLFYIGAVNYILLLKSVAFSHVLEELEISITQYFVARLLHFNVQIHSKHKKSVLLQAFHIWHRTISFQLIRKSCSTQR